MRPRFASLLLAGVAILPPAADKLTGSPRSFIDGSCRAAAWSAGSAKAAKAEVVVGKVTSVAAPSLRQLVGWYRGNTQGRYIAVIDATRAGAPIRLWATVELGGLPCKLVAWRVVRVG